VVSILSKDNIITATIIVLTAAALVGVAFMPWNISIQLK
jgi:hypothetical protein